MAIGRKPTPTHLKLIQGNPGNRKINHAEPVALPVLPEPPDYLSEIARAKYLKDGPRLRDRGLLTDLDIDMFTVYCMEFADWVRCIADCAKFGEIAKTNKTGHLQDSVVRTQRRQAEKSMMQLASEFGFTPSSRSRITVDDEKPVDPLEAYLDGGPTAPSG